MLSIADDLKLSSTQLTDIYGPLTYALKVLSGSIGAENKPNETFGKCFKSSQYRY